MARLAGCSTIPASWRIRNAVGLKRAEIFIDAACEAELARVLALRPAQAQARRRRAGGLHRAVRRLSHRIDTTLPEPQRAGLPRCRDPDDQKFLEAALAAHADLLITKGPGALVLRPAPRALAAVPHRDAAGVRALGFLAGALAAEGAAEGLADIVGHASPPWRARPAPRPSRNACTSSPRAGSARRTRGICAAPGFSGAPADFERDGSIIRSR